MKKYLLCMVAAAFLFGCASGEPAAEEDWQKDLEKYQGQCAEIAFADTKAKIGEVDGLKSDGKSKEANDASREAKQLFDADVAKFNDIKGAADKADADMRDQQSRLANIEGDAMKYAPKEYAEVMKRTAPKYEEAAEKIEACDGEGAAAILGETKADVTYIEELVASRIPKPKDDTAEIYTVKKGDSLWKIAANKYSNPYFWPLIYWTNKHLITKTPDLIYPNQEFVIDRNASDKRKMDAEKLSKTRGPWSLYKNASYPEPAY